MSFELGKMTKTSSMNCPRYMIFFQTLTIIDITNHTYKRSLFFPYQNNLPHSLFEYLLSLFWRFNSLHLKPRRNLVVSMNSSLFSRAVSISILSERKVLIPFPLFSRQWLTLGIEIQWNPLWRTKARLGVCVQAANSQAYYSQLT